MRTNKYSDDEIKKIILNYSLNYDNPTFSPREICDFAREHGISISHSTLYRNKSIMALLRDKQSENRKKNGKLAIPTVNTAYFQTLSKEDLIKQYADFVVSVRETLLIANDALKKNKKLEDEIKQLLEENGKLSEYKDKTKKELTELKSKNKSLREQNIILNESQKTKIFETESPNIIDFDLAKCSKADNAIKSLKGLINTEDEE